MKRALYEIWDERMPVSYPWRAQLPGYVAHFPTKELAESYVASVKAFAAQAKVMRRQE